MGKSKKEREYEERLRNDFGFFFQEIFMKQGTREDEKEQDKHPNDWWKNHTDGDSRYTHNRDYSFDIELMGEFEEFCNQQKQQQAKLECMKCNKGLGEVGSPGLISHGNGYICHWCWVMEVIPPLVLLIEAYKKTHKPSKAWVLNG